MRCPTPHPTAGGPTSFATSRERETLKLVRKFLGVILAAATDKNE